MAATHVTIVAEGGLNHRGVLKYAIELADGAKKAGADIVKFQTFDCAHLLRPNDPDRELLSSLQLTHEQFRRLARHCEEIDIEFMSTPGDLQSLKFLIEDIGVKRIKIGSDDLTNEALVKSAASSDLPIVLSTGMATVVEINAALRLIYANRSHHYCALGVTLLHCVSLYPCPVSKANIGAITDMQKLFGAPVGYSDHTKVPLACAAAVALGAEMIEAHFMLRGPLPSLDAAVSYDPGTFWGLCAAIRCIEELMGEGHKVPCSEELASISKYRKGTDGFRGHAQ